MESSNVFRIQSLLKEIKNYFSPEKESFNVIFFTKFHDNAMQQLDRLNYDLNTFKKQYNFPDFVDALLYLILRLPFNLCHYQLRTEIKASKRNTRRLRQLFDLISLLLDALERENQSAAIQKTEFYFISTNILAALYYFENVDCYTANLTRAYVHLIIHKRDLATYGRYMFKAYEIPTDTLKGLCKIVTSDSIVRIFNKITNAFFIDPDLQVSLTTTKKEVLSLVHSLKGRIFLVVCSQFSGFSDFNGNIYLDQDLLEYPALILVTILYELAYLKGIMSAPNGCPFWRSPAKLGQEPGDLFEIEGIGEVMNNTNVDKYSDILLNIENWVSGKLKAMIIERKREVRRTQAVCPHVQGVKPRVINLRCLNAMGMHKK